MAGTTLANWAQYSKWVWQIGRSFWVTPQSVAEKAACETFVKFFWDAGTSTGSRPWLAIVENHKATVQADQYIGDVDTEPNNFDRKMVEIIGRDLKKIPLTDAEVPVCDALFVATGNRRYNALP